MRHGTVLSVCVAVTMACVGCGKSKPVAKPPKLELVRSDATFDWGTVQMGAKVRGWPVEMFNRGDRPLTLSSPKLSPAELPLEVKLERNTIAPHTKGEMLLLLDTETPLSLEGVLTLHTNDPQQPLLQLKLRGEVAELRDDSSKSVLPSRKARRGEHWKAKREKRHESRRLKAAKKAEAKLRRRPVDEQPL